MGVMNFCKACKEYTLREACPYCGGKVAPNEPAKYSPEDHYGEYRRKLKRLEAAKAQPAGSPTGAGAKPRDDASNAPSPSATGR